MIEKKKLTPLVLAGIFVLMLGLSYAAVPLYDLFCRVTGFGGTTQISNNAPKIAKTIFGYSILYLFLIFVLFLIDKIV